jgi:putative addiction module CopG family antidote
MNIDLKPEQQMVIDSVIRSGAYRNAGEVIDAALRMLSVSSDIPVTDARRSRLWDLRKDVVLGDVSIRELIDSGRE